MLNAATEKFDPIVYCDCPTERYHPPSGLIAPDVPSYRNRGLLCSPIVRPPVHVLFCLRHAIDLHTIVIKPYVGRHRVTHLDVFVLHDKPPMEDYCHTAVAQKVMNLCSHIQPTASIKLDRYPTQTVAVVHLRYDSVIPSSSFMHSAPCLFEVDASPYSNPQREQRYVLLRLCKTVDATCVPCLGGVELWCTKVPFVHIVLPSLEDKAEERRDTSNLDSNQTTSNDHASSDDACTVAPKQFLDALTGDLMREPVRLPSGTYVDRDTLMRFWFQRQQSNNSELPPVDPFTMVVMDETQVTCDENLKASIENYRKRWSQLDRLCCTLDNELFSPEAIRRLPVCESSSEDDSEDGVNILMNHPLLRDTNTN